MIQSAGNVDNTQLIFVASVTKQKFPSFLLFKPLHISSMVVFFQTLNKDFVVMMMESTFRCKIKSFQFSIQFETLTKPSYATSKCENTNNHVTIITW